MSLTRSYLFHWAAMSLTPTTCSLPTAYATSARATALASHARRTVVHSVNRRNRAHRKIGQHDRDAHWLSITICCRLDALVAGVGESPSRAPIAPIAPWAEIPPQELFFDMRTKTQVDRHRRVYTGGGGRFTRACWGYPAPHPDFFIATKMEVGYATVTERPKQALGFTVACNANSFTKRLKTG